MRKYRFMGRIVPGVAGIALVAAFGLASWGCQLVDEGSEGDGYCTPDCSNAECGDDGCGGSCGTCGDGYCSEGICQEGSCEPECSGRECGDDGCGGTCGTCSNGLCTSDGTCEEAVGTLTGTLSFEVIWPRIDESDSVVLDQRTEFPASSMLGLLYDGNGDYMSGVFLDYDGSFTFPLPYDSPKGDETLVFATLWAPDPDAEYVSLAVLKPEDGTGIETATSKPWAWSFSVGTSSDVGSLTISEQDGSGAMFVFLFMASAMETIVQDILDGDESGLTSLAVLWKPNHTWDCGSCYAKFLSQNVDGGMTTDQTIFINGDPTYSSAWGFPVILHEFGHYVAANYSRDNSPGGFHDGSPVVPPFAWSEGWASFYSVSSISRWYGEPFPLFWDIQQNFSYWIDYSSASVSAGLKGITTPAPNGGIEQDLAEDYVATMLWNLWDGDDVAEAQGSEDGSALGTYRVLSAISSDRFVSGDRGYSGADFVDFVDAVVCLFPDEESAVVDTVVEWLGFPYDGNTECN